MCVWKHYLRDPTSRFLANIRESQFGQFSVILLSDNRQRVVLRMYSVHKRSLNLKLIFSLCDVAQTSHKTIQGSTVFSEVNVAEYY